VTSDPVADVRRREYPEPRDGVFLNAASWGLIPRSAAAESADLTQRRNRTHGFEEAELGAIQRRARAAIGRLLSVDSDEVALAPNTSFGVSLAATLLRGGNPGTIVVSEGEFPANVLPFKALEPNGFRVRVVPAGNDGLPDESAMVAALDGDDVRALAVSTVQFASGYRADLGTLGAACRARGVLFFVDAIQGLGAVPFHPREVHADIVASGGQKWLCSPWGSGFAYVRRELQERFTPPIVSWLAMRGAGQFGDMLHYRMDWRTDARKFEPATLGIQDYLGLARSVEILLEMGVEAVWRQIRAVQDPLWDWIASRPDVRPITPLDDERRAGIVSFVPPDTDAVERALLDRRVVFSVREGTIRFAPHFYNTVEEMESVVELLDGAVP